MAHSLFEKLHVKYTGFKFTILNKYKWLPKYLNVKEINPATMESKLINNLFFAGEIIDVDAYTGGFNLQIAFSTGYLAGGSVK